MLKRSNFLALVSVCTLSIARLPHCIAQGLVPPAPPPMVHHLHTFTPPVADISQSHFNHTHQHQPDIQPAHSHQNDQQSGFHHHHLNSLDNSNVKASNTDNYHHAHVWSNLSLSGTSSLNLDLSSNTANVTAGHLLHSGTITIDVGGSNLVVNSTTKLTPAEYLAVRQVELTGQQSLVLNSQGSAVGGTVVIGQHLSQLISNLVIPQGVSVVDLTKSGTININGNITDNGYLYIDSKNSLLSTINLNANNINVEGHGILSDIVPPNLIASAAHGISHLNNNLNLSLGVANNLNNAGNITSAGSLNIVSGSGNITNNGLITSNQGNINISAASPSTNIAITSSGGTFQAQESINVRDASYTGSANIDINGGNYLSQTVNLYSGTGAVNASVGQITGEVNTKAGIEHFFANTDNLVLGNHCVTGDPTYANTGNITVSGLINPGEAIAIIAGGSVLSDATGQITTNGSDVTIVAGANITSGGGSGGQTITNATPGVGSPVTFSFDNAHNGNIDFTPSPNAAITTNGGNVTLLAYHVVAGTGDVWLPTASTINTSNTGGAGGNLLIVAGGAGGNSQIGTIASAIQLGGIITAGTTTSGTVTIYTANPVITGGSATYNTNGQLTSGSYPTTAGSYTFNNSGQITIASSVVTAGNGGAGDFNQGSDGTAAADITIHGGNNVTLSNLLAWGGGGGGGGPIGGAGGAGGNGGNISVTSDTGNISVTGELNSSGGGGGGTYSGGGGAGGVAGTITLNAGGNISVSRSILASNGGAGGNGFGPGGGGGGSFGGGGGGGGGFTQSGGGGGNGAFSGGGGAGSNSSFANGGGGGGGWISGAGAAGDAFIPFGGTGVDGNPGSTTSNGAWNPINGTFGVTGGAGGSSGSSLAGGIGNNFFIAGGGQTTGGNAGNGFAGNNISSTSATATSYSQNGAGFIANNITLTNTAAPGVATTEITTNALIAATTALTIQAVGSGGGLVININASGGTTTLTATGAGTINSTAPITGTTSIILNGGSGAIGSLNIATPNITFNTTGNVTLVDTTALTGNGISTAVSLNFTDSSSSGITVDHSITTTSTLSLTNTGTNSPITINGALSGTTVTLTATGSGNIIGTGTIRGSSISLLTSTGNIAGNSGATSSLSVNNGGSGLVLYAQGNAINLSDNQNESVTLNGSGNITASNSFTLSTVGNIITSIPVRSPAISLTSAGGNIGGNSSASSAAQVNNGGAGLLLYAHGAIVNLTDNYNEAVTLTGITNNTILGPTSFTLSTVGNIIGNSAIFNTSGSGIIFNSYSGTTSQTFTGNSFSSSSNTIFVVINSTTYLYSFVGPISNGETIIFSPLGGGNTLALVNNTGSTLTSTASTVIALNTYFQNGSALYPNAPIQSPVITLNSANGSIGSSSFPVNINNNGNGINSLYTLATNGSIYLNDTAHENVILSNQITSGVSAAGNIFSLSTYGSIYSSSTVLPFTELAISAPTIMLSSSNGNIAQDSSNLFDAFEVTGGGGGLTLNANVPGGSVTITDDTNENVTLTTLGTGGLCRAFNSFTVEVIGNIFSTDLQLSIQCPVILLTSNGNIAADSTNDPLLISGGGSGISALLAFTQTGNVYLSDTTHESVTLATENVGRLSSANSIFSLHTYGNILASDTSSAIQASNIDLNSSNGSIGTNSIPISVAAPSIAFNSSNNVFITDTVALTSNNASTAGILVFTDTASGGMNITNNVTANSISLISSGNNGSISEASSVHIQGSSSVELTTDDTINIAGILSSGNSVALNADGVITIGTTASITSTGNMAFAGASGPGNIIVHNNGSLISSGSIIGFNGGDSGTITISGTGTISGAGGVHVGNLDPSTLQMVGPYTTVSPFTGTYTNQTGNITITQTSITSTSGTLQVTGYTPSPSGGGSTTTIVAGPSAQQQLFYLLNFIALQQSLQQQANNILDEQISTRIPIDYTPWTTYPMQPQQFPLQASISRNEISGIGQQILFAASEFNANELAALSQAGVVFGPGSGNNFLDLQKGYVFFMPNHPIQVQTQEGIAYLPAGSTTAIFETGHDVAFCCYHNSWRTGVVKIVVNGREFVIAPGKELLLTKNGTADFAELNPVRSVGYRNVRSTDVGQGIKAYVCDFSIAHGLANEPTLQSLLASNDRVHKKAARKMLLNAAILADLTGNLDYKTQP